MRALRFILVGLAAVLAVLGLGLGWFVWFGGSDAHRWIAHRALETALNREVHVDGEFSVELADAPVFRLTGVRIDAADWAEAPGLLQLERAEVSIALRPLLRRSSAGICL